jgi:hypothetical protein
MVNLVKNSRAFPESADKRKRMSGYTKKAVDIVLEHMVLTTEKTYG